MNKKIKYCIIFSLALKFMIFSGKADKIFPILLASSLLTIIISVNYLIFYKIIDIIKRKNRTIAILYAIKEMLLFHAAINCLLIGSILIKGLNEFIFIGWFVALIHSRARINKEIDTQTKGDFIPQPVLKDKVEDKISDSPSTGILEKITIIISKIEDKQLLEATEIQ